MRARFAAMTWALLFPRLHTAVSFLTIVADLKPTIGCVKVRVWEHGAAQ